MVQIEATEEPRAVATKRRILEAASRVFRRRGLHATGMRDIAAELGMHVGNLYYYFENKQELLAFCQQDTLAGLQALARRVEGLRLSPEQQLYLLLVGHVECLHEGTPGSLAHLEVEALEEPWRAAIMARRHEYERAIRRLVERGVAAGVFRAVDPTVAALALLGAVNWTVKWYRRQGRRSLRQISALIAEIQVRGLLAPEASLKLPSPDLLEDTDS